MDRAQAGQPAADYDPAIARAQRMDRWACRATTAAGRAFDVDNIYDYLNNIPFADHGALLDPPTEDVTARCVSMLAQLGETRGDEHGGRSAAIDYLRRTQLAGRQLVRPLGHELHLRHLVGAVRAQRRRRRSPATPMMRKAVDWLVAIQNADGGWGEDGASYKLDYKGYERAPSTASQTAWALLGLMAAGEVDNPAVARGIDYLARTQGGDGFWDEARYTATGFPRVFYLRYHGYSKFFPLWALARYRNLKSGNARTVAFGM